MDKRKSFLVARHLHGDALFLCLENNDLPNVLQSLLISDLQLQG